MTTNTNTNSEAELFTVREVATRLGVSVDTVCRWLRSGRMSHFRMSRQSIRVSQAHIEEFMADCTVTKADRWAELAPKKLPERQNATEVYKQPGRAKTGSHGTTKGKSAREYGKMLRERRTHDPSRER